MLVMAFALVLQVQSLLFCIPKLHAKHTAVLLTLTRLPGVNVNGGCWFGCNSLSHYPFFPEAVKFDNKLIFFLGEVSAFEIRAQVVDPPETAALAAAEESGGLGEGAPATFAVGSDVSDKPFVFFFSPSALVGVSFLTARRPSHNRPLQTRIEQENCGAVLKTHYPPTSFPLFLPHVTLFPNYTPVPHFHFALAPPQTELNTVTSKHDDLICPDSLAAA
nr:hypothetical protein BHM03_00060017 [Ipomoea batatas]